MSLITVDKNKHKDKEREKDREKAKTSNYIGSSYSPGVVQSPCTSKGFPL